MIIAVIPAYNEEKTIKEVIKDVKKYVDEIIIVDDGSKDKTEIIAREAGAIVLKHIINRGQGAALGTGNKYALMRGADIIVHFDGDGQHMASDIDKLIEPIKNKECDIVLGSKFLANTDYIPFTKKFFILKPAIILNRFLTGINLTDVHNGLRAMSNTSAEKIKITQDKMAHNTEIPVEIKRNNLKWSEVPVNFIYNEYGQGFSGGLEILRDLFFRKII